VVDRNTQEANWQAAINGTFSPLTGHTQLSERQKLRPVQEWRRESDPSRRPGVGRKADAIAHRNAAPTDCHETR